MNSYSPESYWTELAETCSKTDGKGLAPVMHPGTPLWFNGMIDQVQMRSIRRALALAGLLPDSRILDIGCGTGRWVKRYQELGFHVTGLDATLPMLRLARENGTDSPLIAAEANRLPCASETFDCVSDITVVQHIPSSEQPKAICEMLRVLKPGGRLILMELIRGSGPHIFPRTPKDWVEHVVSCGAKLIGWFAEEYLLLDRFFVRAVQIASRNRSRTSLGLSTRSVLKDVSPARRAYWAIRRISVPISIWADPLVARLVPANWATHGVFVFRK